MFNFFTQCFPLLSPSDSSMMKVNGAKGRMEVINQWLVPAYLIRVQAVFSDNPISALSLFLIFFPRITSEFTVQTSSRP